VLIYFHYNGETQQAVTYNDSINGDVLDKRYREDHFYFSVNYNLLNHMPKDMSQNGFSIGLSLGYIRDIPLNDNRNFGLGLGIGFTTNSINQNLKISKTNDDIMYDIIDSEDFSKNKLSAQVIELPFELRWRTSTPSEYKFWRVYAGFKLGYVVAANSKFKGGGDQVSISNLKSELNEWQYGLTLSAGYNTWNVNFYYGLNTFFDENVQINGQKNKTRLVKIGLIFYLL